MFSADSKAPYWNDPDLAILKGSKKLDRTSQDHSHRERRLPGGFRHLSSFLASAVYLDSAE
jgi:hypothetical protein